MPSFSDENEFEFVGFPLTPIDLVLREYLVSQGKTVIDQRVLNQRLFKRTRFFQILKSFRLAFNILKQIILAKKGKKRKLAKNKVFTYFPAYEIGKDGAFSSTYWGELSSEFQKSQDLSWIFLFTEGKVDFNEGLQRRNEIQKSNPSHQFHFLEEFFYLSSLPKLLKTYFILWKKYFKLKKEHRVFQFNSSINLADFFDDLLFESLVGTWGITRIFQNEMLKGIFQSEEPGKTLFIWENQGWERSLCFHAHRANDETFGYQHTTVPEYEMRHFTTRREYFDLDQYVQPRRVSCLLPDKGREKLWQNGDTLKVK